MNPAGIKSQKNEKMKKLTLLISTIFLTLILHQCTDRSLSLEQTELPLDRSLAKQEKEHNSAKDSTKSGSEILIVKDPPVRDGDDWRQSSTK
ncbi:hypothetical protein DRF67_10935 [Chryseobacterium pennipullorum]|uniref:Uncharacterized protein n=2 Tax=Chryseobacterium pennipullorum TaxID=2258963 RepID=A0A3D9B1Z3_9FLAO|nr:hypothetical protein DRF67_10935 [Chryseobacterium pennipullorum]